LQQRGAEFLFAGLRIPESSSDALAAPEVPNAPLQVQVCGDELRIAESWREISSTRAGPRVMMSKVRRQLKPDRKCRGLKRSFQSRNADN